MVAEVEQSVAETRAECPSGPRSQCHSGFGSSRRGKAWKVAPDRSGATFYLVPLDARCISQNGAYILASPTRAAVPLVMSGRF
jgi:hypothetical protein